MMIQKTGFLKIADFGSFLSFSGWFIKSTAKTGFIIKATTSEAASVKMSMVGKYTINRPMIPGQKSKGKKGASVVSVPANTGMNTSPAALLVAISIGILPFPSTKIRCVFSITTMASSTIIPSPNNRANNTIKLRVTWVPIIKSAPGKNTKATNILSGTLSATKKALVTPIKNISTISTSKNPMMIEFTSSLKEAFVFTLWSPVITAFKLSGKVTPLFSLTTFCTCSLVSIRFSPLLLMMFSVTTFFPSRRAKLSAFLVVSFITAMSFR